MVRISFAVVGKMVVVVAFIRLQHITIFEKKSNDKIISKKAPEYDN